MFSPRPASRLYIPVRHQLAAAWSVRSRAENQIRQSSFPAQYPFIHHPAPWLCFLSLYASLLSAAQRRSHSWLTAHSPQGSFDPYLSYVDYCIAFDWLHRIACVPVCRLYAGCYAVAYTYSKHACMKVLWMGRLHALVRRVRWASSRTRRISIYETLISSC